MTPVELIALAASTSLLAGWRLYLVTLDHRARHEIRLDRAARPARTRSTCWPTIGCWASPRSAPSPNSSPTRSPGSTAPGTRSTASSGRSAARSSASPSSIAPTRPGRSAASCSAAARRFMAHAGKAGARTLVNASPEPFSNVIVSTARGCRHRRPARAGHRQSDRRRDHRARPGAAVALAGVCRPARAQNA